MNNQTIVVTRHKALVEYLREQGMIDDSCAVINHVTNSEDVIGKDVIGVLPLSLAAKANSVTEIPLRLTPEMRGQELNLETLRKVAGKPVKYKVEVL